MTDSDNIIFDTATRIFDDLSTPEVINAVEEGTWPAELWQAISESGLTLTWVPEESGGVGASMLEGFAVIKAAGGAALPVPLAETLFAGWLLAQGGLQVSGAAASVAIGELSLDGNVLRGSAAVVPGARHTQDLVALVRDGDKQRIVRVATAKCALDQGTNLAGEAWDCVSFEGVSVEDKADAPAGLSVDRVQALGALIRCVQAAGAMATALELTIEYSMDRVQFGRPIGKFQALQHSIAGFAGEVAAINAAADAAAEAVARVGGVDDEAWVEIAAAKVRLEQAVNNGAAVAHQVHGAIGFTYEHRLHHLTRRLWSWRDEYGSEVVWARRLGDVVLGWGKEQLWPRITAVSDAR